MNICKIAMSAFPGGGRILFWKIILTLQKLASTQLLSGDISGILKRLFIRNLVHINFCDLKIMQINSPSGWIVFRSKESLAKYKREVPPVLSELNYALFPPTKTVRKIITCRRLSVNYSSITSFEFLKLFLWWFV